MSDDAVLWAREILDGVPYTLRPQRPRCPEMCGDRRCFLDVDHKGECTPLPALIMGAT